MASSFAFERRPPRLALVAAVARNGVIGSDNALPWRLPEDLRRFRAITSGHSVVMGRRTLESIGRALPERQNIVVTSRPEVGIADVLIVRSLEQALAAATLPPPVLCIGGGQLYRVALPLADRLYITEIARDFEGDVRFPEIDTLDWCEVERSKGRDDTAGFDYAFVTYDRRRGIAPPA